MWISHIHHCSSHVAHTGKVDRPRHHTRNAHLAFNKVKRIVGLDYTASTQTSMSIQGYLSPAFTVGKPRCDATRPIAGELCLAAVCIKQTQEQIPVGSALQELNTIGAHTCVSRTKLARELCVTALGQRLFDNQEVIAAGVRFNEGNHVSLLCLSVLCNDLRLRPRWRSGRAIRSIDPRAWLARRA